MAKGEPFVKLIRTCNGYKNNARLRLRKKIILWTILFPVPIHMLAHNFFLHKKIHNFQEINIYIPLQCTFKTQKKHSDKKTICIKEYIIMIFLLKQEKMQELTSPT